MAKSTAVTVLGMHRSGTSAVAGSLKEAGVFLGRVLDKSIEHNRKGLHEPPAILYMQEDLLIKNGGAWHTPPASVEWGALHTAVRDLFIESRAEQPLWGFKDPRTVLTIEGWLDALPDLRALCVFRHPAEVALSLARRNGFELARGYQIWDAYNRRLADLAERHAFPVIEYRVDAVDFKKSLAAAIERLGVPSPESFEFFDAGLKNNASPETDIAPPQEVMSLYHRLQALAA